MIPFVQQLQAEEPRRLFAAGKAAAYYMSPPELAVKPFVTSIAWTADGGALLAKRLVPSPDASPLAIANAQQTPGLSGMMELRPHVQLVAWPLRGKTPRTVLDFDSARANIEEIEPMPASDRALVLITERTPLPDGTLSAPRSSYLLVAVGTGAATRLWTAESAETRTAIQLSPSRPLGAVVRREPPKQIGAPAIAARGSVALFGPDGKIGPELPILPQQRFAFAADGGPGVAMIKTNAKGKPYYEFHRLDPKTGAVGPIAVEKDFEEAEPKEPPMQVGLGHPPQGEAGIFLHVAGGEKDELGLVSIDGALPLLSPKNDAVAYIMGSGAYVRPLVKVNRGEYDLALLASEKAKAMSAAKQVGLAVSMYAMDYDGVFPSGDINGPVDPYLRDPKMLRAFTYTFGGGELSGDQSTIMLGFVAGPGGRAVVYADGRVVWVPD